MCSTRPESILKIMDYCSIIKQYTQFIELVRKYKNSRRGLKRAVDEAIKQGILADFLEENFKDVVNMLCARYSYKTDVRINAEEMAHHLAKEYAKDMAKDIAKQMLDDNMSMEQVMKYSSLSEEKIKSL